MVGKNNVSLVSLLQQGDLSNGKALYFKLSSIAIMPDLINSKILTFCTVSLKRQCENVSTRLRLNGPEKKCHIGKVDRVTGLKDPLEVGYTSQHSLLSWSKVGFLLLLVRCTSSQFY